MKKLKIHPEVKSAINSFFAGFLPVLVLNIEHIDFTTMKFSVISGIVIVAFRTAFKYGLAELFKWILKKMKLVEW